MGSNTTPDNMRAFIVPRFQDLNSIWESQSTATQQNPQGGVPVAQRASGLVLQTTGDMAADEHIEVLTQRAGHAGAKGQAKFVWRDATTGDYYGRNTANVISYAQHVTGSATVDVIPRDVLSTSNGFTILVVETQTTAAVPKLQIIVRDSTGAHTTTATLITAETTSLNDKLFAGLCELADGSLLCAAWSHDVNASKANVNVYRSEDNASTWTQISTNAISDSIGTSAASSDFVVDRIRIRANLGQVLMIAQLISNDTTTNRMRIGQFASTDNGGSFSQITVTDGTEQKGFPSLGVVSEQFVLSVVTAADNAYIYRFSNAFLNLSVVETNVTLKKSINLGGGATVATTTSNAFTAGQSSMWVDDDDVIWIVFEQLDSTPFMFIMRSDDFGDTFTGMGLGTSGAQLNDDSQWFSQAAGSTLENVVGVSYGGTQIIYHNFSSIDVSTLEGNMGVIQLGGYSSVTMPPVDFLSGDTARATWTRNYLPFDKPDAVGFSVNTSGTSSATVSTDGLALSTTSGIIAYSINITNSLTAGAIVRTRFNVISRGTNTKTIQIRISNGSSISQTVSLFVDTTQLRLRDDEAGAYLHSATTVTTNGTFDVLIALADGQVNAYYLDDTAGKVKKWNTLFQGAVTNGSSTQAYVAFGHMDTSTASTGFMEFHYGDTTRTGVQLATGQNNPAEIWARGFPGRGKFTNITGSLQISTVDGGTYEGDSWHIDPSFEYPIQNIFYKVSPSNTTEWRSVKSGSTSVSSMLIPWFTDDTAQDMTIMRNDIMAVHLENINFKDFKIRKHDGSSWSDIATIENVAYDGNFQRHGASLIGTVSGSNFPYFFYNECAGWYAKMTPSGGGTVKIRKIRTNSEGSFANVTNKQSIIYLEGIDGTEPTSGTLEIIPSRCTVLINLLGTSNNREAKAYGLEIQTQDVMEQYFKIGGLAFGELFVFGRQYSRGRSIAYDAGVEINERNDGATFHRITGNEGRTVRISWAEGVDSSQLHDDDASPNFFVGSTSSGAEAIANVNDIPESMIGLARYLQGPARALVYVSKFIKSTSTANDVQLLNRYGEAIMVTLDSEIEIENVIGDEFNGLGSGELFRVSTVRMREVR